VRALAVKSGDTVSQTDEISKKAADSVAAIDVKIENIATAILKAHSEINDLYSSTQIALKDFAD
jgi:hypothetical protein